MQAKVDAEIELATTEPMEPERQRIRVIRWNAMREVLDDMQSSVQQALAERERIRKEEQVDHAGNN